MDNTLSPYALFKRWFVELSVSTAHAFVHLFIHGAHINVPDRVDLDGRTIAILVPHPDDEVIGCFHFAEQFGSEFTIDLIYVTEAEDQRLKNMRWLESGRATESLPVSARIRWGFPDGALVVCRDELRARLRELGNCYDVVLSPAPNDQTPDHAVLADEVLSVIDVKRIFWYRSTWLTFKLSEADFVVRGSAMTKKLALDCFVSQRALALKNSIGIGRIEAANLGDFSNSIEGFRRATSGVSCSKPLNVLSFKTVFRIWGWL